MPYVMLLVILNFLVYKSLHNVSFIILQRPLMEHQKTSLDLPEFF